MLLKWHVTFQIIPLPQMTLQETLQHFPKVSLETITGMICLFDNFSGESPTSIIHNCQKILSFRKFFEIDDSLNMVI